VDLGGKLIGLTVDTVEDLVEVDDSELVPHGAGSAAGWEVRLEEGPPARLLDLDHLLEPLFRE
jgi:hypothetical protein